MTKYRLLNTIDDVAAMHMASDEAISIECSRKNSPYTLRFYTFNPSAITLGYGQRIQNLDLKKLEESPLDYVRRMSGGTAVLHDGDLTYALIISEDDVPEKVIEAYKYLSQGLINGLRNLGIRANYRTKEPNKTEQSCYINENPYDVVVRDKKISGNAQSRSNGVVVQHGTIIVDNKHQRLLDYLVLSQQKRKALLSQLEKKVTSLNDEAKRQIPLEELEAAFIKGFEELFFEQEISLEKAPLTKREKELALELYKTKYSTKQWNHLR